MSWECSLTHIYVWVAGKIIKLSKNKKAFTINGFLKLFELEREKFDSGDGTIFLLNTREKRYLNSRIKTIEQKSKYIHTLVDYLRETGKISQSFFGPDGL